MQAESPLEASRMGNAPRRRATYDDLCKVPDNLVAEILEGELFTSPRPASPHALAASVIGAELVGAFHCPPGDPKGPGGWWLLFAPELHFGEDVLVPDFAGWRREAMPVLPNVAAFRQAPQWVLEVVSPGTCPIDRVRKLPIYAREGVAHAWLVDPLARTLEVYRLTEGHWLLAATHEGDEMVRAEPFEAMELALSRWWIPQAEEAGA
jgi:Uma2 family endonuclease